MNKAVIFVFVTIFNDVAVPVSPWSLRCCSVRLFFFIFYLLFFFALCRVLREFIALPCTLSIYCM